MPKKMSRLQEFAYYRKKRKQIFKDAYQKELVAAKRSRRKKRVAGIKKKAQAKAQFDVKPLHERVVVRGQQVRSGADKAQKGLQKFSAGMSEFQSGFGEGMGSSKKRRAKSLDEIMDDCMNFKY